MIKKILIITAFLSFAEMFLFFFQPFLTLIISGVLFTTFLVSSIIAFKKKSDTKILCLSLTVFHLMVTLSSFILTSYSILSIKLDL